MKNVSVEVRSLCRFCRAEWRQWLIAMLRAADEAAMLPGQEQSPRRAEKLAVQSPLDLQVEFIVSSDAEIAAVNIRNLACSGPTNILSFPGNDGFALGSMFLSADTLEREAILYGQDVREHAIRLLAHGMGHICGLDHSREMSDFCLYLEEAAANPMELNA